MRVVIIAKMKKSTKDIGGLPTKCTTCTRAEFYTVETIYVSSRCLPNLDTASGRRGKICAVR